MSSKYKCRVFYLENFTVLWQLPSGANTLPNVTFIEKENPTNFANLKEHNFSAYLKAHSIKYKGSGKGLYHFLITCSKATRLDVLKKLTVTITNRTNEHESLSGLLTYFGSVEGVIAEIIQMKQSEHGTGSIIACLTEFRQIHFEPTLIQLNSVAREYSKSKLCVIDQNISFINVDRTLICAPCASANLVNKIGSSNLELPVSTDIFAYSGYLLTFAILLYEAGLRATKYLVDLTDSTNTGGQLTVKRCKVDWPNSNVSYTKLTVMPVKWSNDEYVLVCYHPAQTHFNEQQKESEVKAVTTRTALFVFVGNFVDFDNFLNADKLAKIQAKNYYINCNRGLLVLPRIIMSQTEFYANRTSQIFRSSACTRTASSSIDDTYICLTIVQFCVLVSNVVACDKDTCDEKTLLELVTHCHCLVYVGSRMRFQAFVKQNLFRPNFIGYFDEERCISGRQELFRQIFESKIVETTKGILLDACILCGNKNNTVSFLSLTCDSTPHVKSSRVAPRTKIHHVSELHFSGTVAQFITYLAFNGTLVAAKAANLHLTFYSKTFDIVLQKSTTFNMKTSDPLVYGGENITFVALLYNNEAILQVNERTTDDDDIFEHECVIEDISALLTQYKIAYFHYVGSATTIVEILLRATERTNKPLRFKLGTNILPSCLWPFDELRDSWFHFNTCETPSDALLHVGMLKMIDSTNAIVTPLYFCTQNMQFENAVQFCLQGTILPKHYHNLTHAFYKGSIDVVAALSLNIFKSMQFITIQLSGFVNNRLQRVDICRVTDKTCVCVDLTIVDSDHGCVLCQRLVKEEPGTGFGILDFAGDYCSVPTVWCLYLETYLSILREHVVLHEPLHQFYVATEQPPHANVDMQVILDRVYPLTGDDIVKIGAHCYNVIGFVTDHDKYLIIGLRRLLKQSMDITWAQFVGKCASNVTVLLEANSFDGLVTAMSLPKVRSSAGKDSIYFDFRNTSDMFAEENEFLIEGNTFRVIVISMSNESVVLIDLLNVCTHESFDEHKNLNARNKLREDLARCRLFQYSGSRNGFLLMWQWVNPVQRHYDAWLILADDENETIWSVLTSGVYILKSLFSNTFVACLFSACEFYLPVILEQKNSTDYGNYETAFNFFHQNKIFDDATFVGYYGSHIGVNIFVKECVRGSLCCLATVDGIEYSFNFVRSPQMLYYQLKESKYGRNGLQNFVSAKLIAVITDAFGIELSDPLFLAFEPSCMFSRKWEHGHLSTFALYSSHDMRSITVFENEEPVPCVVSFYVDQPHDIVTTLFCFCGTLNTLLQLLCLFDITARHVILKVKDCQALNGLFDIYMDRVSIPSESCLYKLIQVKQEERTVLFSLWNTNYIPHFEVIGDGISKTDERPHSLNITYLVKEQVPTEVDIYLFCGTSDSLAYLCLEGLMPQTANTVCFSFDSQQTCNRFDFCNENEILKVFSVDINVGRHRILQLFAAVLNKPKALDKKQTIVILSEMPFENKYPINPSDVSALLGDAYHLVFSVQLEIFAKIFPFVVPYCDNVSFSCRLNSGCSFYNIQLLETSLVDYPNALYRCSICDESRTSYLLFADLFSTHNPQYFVVTPVHLKTKLHTDYFEFRGSLRLLCTLLDTYYVRAEMSHVSILGTRAPHLTLFDSADFRSCSMSITADRYVEYGNYVISCRIILVSESESFIILRECTENNSNVVREKTLMKDESMPISFVAFQGSLAAFAMLVFNNVFSEMAVQTTSVTTFLVDFSDIDTTWCGENLYKLEYNEIITPARRFCVSILSIEYHGIWKSVSYFVQETKSDIKGTLQPQSVHETPDDTCDFVHFAGTVAGFAELIARKLLPTVHNGYYSLHIANGTCYDPCFIVERSHTNEHNYSLALYTKKSEVQPVNNGEVPSVLLMAVFAENLIPNGEAGDHCNPMIFTHAHTSTYTVFVGTETDFEQYVNQLNHENASSNFALITQSGVRNEQKTNILCWNRSILTLNTESANRYFLDVLQNSFEVEFLIVRQINGVPCNCTGSTNNDLNEISKCRSFLYTGTVASYCLLMQSKKLLNTDRGNLNFPTTKSIQLQNGDLYFKSGLMKFGDNAITLRYISTLCHETRIAYISEKTDGNGYNHQSEKLNFIDNKVLILGFKGNTTTFFVLAFDLLLNCKHEWCTVHAELSHAALYSWFPTLHQTCMTVYNLQTLPSTVIHTPDSLYKLSGIKMLPVSPSRNSPELYLVDALLNDKNNVSQQKEEQCPIFDETKIGECYLIVYKGCLTCLSEVLLRTTHPVTKCIAQFEEGILPSGFCIANIKRTERNDCIIIELQCERLDNNALGIVPTPAVYINVEATIPRLVDWLHDSKNLSSTAPSMEVRLMPGSPNLRFISVTLSNVKSMEPKAFLMQKERTRYLIRAVCFGPLGLHCVSAREKPLRVEYNEIDRPETISVMNIEYYILLHYYGTESGLHEFLFTCGPTTPYKFILWYCFKQANITANNGASNDSLPSGAYLIHCHVERDGRILDIFNWTRSNTVYNVQAEPQPPMDNDYKAAMEPSNRKRVLLTGSHACSFLKEVDECYVDASEMTTDKTKIDETEKRVINQLTVLFNRHGESKALQVIVPCAKLSNLAVRNHDVLAINLDWETVCRLILLKGTSLEHSLNSRNSLISQSLSFFCSADSSKSQKVPELARGHGFEIEALSATNSTRYTLAYVKCKLNSILKKIAHHIRKLSERSDYSIQLQRFIDRRSFELSAENILYSGSFKYFQQFLMCARLKNVTRMVCQLTKVSIKDGKLPRVYSVGDRRPTMICHFYFPVSIESETITNCLKLVNTQININCENLCVYTGTVLENNQKFTELFSKTNSTTMISNGHELNNSTSTTYDTTSLCSAITISSDDSDSIDSSKEVAISRKNTI